MRRRCGRTARGVAQGAANGSRRSSSVPLIGGSRVENGISSARLIGEGTGRSATSETPFVATRTTGRPGSPRTPRSRLLQGSTTARPPAGDARFSYCMEQDIGVLARVPLASGFRAANTRPAPIRPNDFRASKSSRDRRELREVERLAREEVPAGVPMAQWAGVVPPAPGGQCRHSRMQERRAGQEQCRGGGVVGEKHPQAILEGIPNLKLKSQQSQDRKPQPSPGDL